MNDDIQQPQAPLTPDEQAVTDYLSGVLKDLPAPVAPASPDRERLEDLMMIRNEVGQAVITPVMSTTFDDVLKRAGANPAGNGFGRVLDWMAAGWGFRLTAAAAVMIIFAVGAVASSPNLMRSREATGGVAPSVASRAEDRRNMADNFASMQALPTTEEVRLHDVDGTLPATMHPSEGSKAEVWGNTMIRQGRVGLRHENPAEVQRKITDELTAYGGMVVKLSRSGVGEHTSVNMDVAVPSEKYGRFVTAVSAFGEVISQSESAEDAIADVISNEAALAEAKDYLKRLDALSDKTPANLAEAQHLERERRQARRDIERFQRALDMLKKRTSMASLSISISTKRADPVPPSPPTAFEKAFQEGLNGLTAFTAFLMQVAMVTLPLSIPVILLLVLLRRRRVPYAQQ